MDTLFSETPMLMLLALLVILSAFFSASETAMMALNRYRLRHLVKKGHKGAQRAQQLLQRPDRLLGSILVGNNIANILATSIATALAVHLWGDKGIVITTLALTLIILIFAEVTPKTLAALHADQVAFSISALLVPIQWVFYPLVWLINGISNSLLRPFGVRPEKVKDVALNADELRTVVHESGTVLPLKRKGMLLGVLDLEKVSVNDIMVPRNDIKGINMADDIDTLLMQMRTIEHTRIPVYNGDINAMEGMLHMRNVAHLLSLSHIDKATLLAQCDPAYFVPESTPLHTQLVNFQKMKQRVAIVVDEYGDVDGLVTLEDILEEIVGEFTTDDESQDMCYLDDGRYWVDATLTLREINKMLGWSLPKQGPKTLNGLIMEILEEIPDAPACLQCGAYRIEIVEIKENLVVSAYLFKHE